MKSVQFRVEGLTLINEWFGDEPDDFCVEVHCEVASPATPGGEAFLVVAMGPRRLARELGEPSEHVELGRGYVFMLDYDRRALEARLQELLDGSGASSWDELTEYVGRYFEWI